MVLLVLQTLSLFLSIFVGDQLVVIFTVLSTATVMREWYCVTHHASVSGTIKILVELGNLGMSNLIGALYDSEIENESSMSHGLKCFRTTFFISTLLTVVSLVSLLVIYKS